MLRVKSVITPEELKQLSLQRPPDFTENDLNEITEEVTQEYGIVGLRLALATGASPAVIGGMIAMLCTIERLLRHKEAKYATVA